MNRSSLPFERVALETLENHIVTDGNLMIYPDTCAMFLCKSGEASISLNGENYHIKAGDVYVYLPSTYMYVESTSKDLSGITYKASLDFILPLMEKSTYTRYIFSLRKRPCISLTEEQQGYVEQLLDVIDSRTTTLNHLTDGNPAREIIKRSLHKLGEAMIHEIFYYFFCNLPELEVVTDKREEVYLNFIVSLMEHYKMKREVGYYAQEQCLSPRYFSSIIKEKTGASAQQVIIQVAINGIKQTLLYSSKSIKEIASEYHFPNQSFFGKYFKQYVGLSPKDFRVSMREKENRPNLHG